ncbi:MAG: glutamate 5-kinase [Acidobacteriota bacterium]|nr:MAG: glutamate 5-kinase [Acidobacteriota bacterium]
METPAIVAKRLRDVRRVVVKVGTNLLRGTGEGLNLEFMDALAQQIVELRARGISVLLVSSGAVGAGAYAMGFDTPPTETSQRQALAAIGQPRLMRHYKLAFGRHDVTVAQVLLTRDSLDKRERYLNARNTFDTLFDWGIVPIANENDTIAVEELKFGDNDQLSALIAGKIGADLLVLLTDVDGIYDRNPEEQGARRIPFLALKDHGTVEIGEGGARSFGLGGMRSKLTAVRLAARAGILAFIGPGRAPNILHRVLDGDAVGTWCEPNEQKISARKRWLALGKRPGEGRIRIDSGAAAALLHGGKSLLPSGVVQVSGGFGRGDLIHILGPSREEIALGLSQYSAQELAAVQGRRSDEIESLVGERQNFEVVHRDDMVILTGEQSDD